MVFVGFTLGDAEHVLDRFHAAKTEQGQEHGTCRNWE